MYCGNNEETTSFDYSIKDFEFSNKEINERFMNLLESDFSNLIEEFSILELKQVVKIMLIIEKIENEKSLAHPDEILAMAKAYQNPLLCNYYCSNECPIGQKYVPELELKTLSQITLEILASLNAMEQEKNRLIEITVDGHIGLNELEDFNQIHSQLSEISVAVDSLRLWLETVAATGKNDS